MSFDFATEEEFAAASQESSWRASLPAAASFFSSPEMVPQAAGGTDAFATNISTFFKAIALETLRASTLVGPELAAVLTCATILKLAVARFPLPRRMRWNPSRLDHN
jgi:hypothetical protein